MARRRTRSRTGRLPQGRAAEPEHEDPGAEEEHYEEEEPPRGRSGRSGRPAAGGAGGGAMAGAGEGEKKKQRGRMIWGLILLIAGAVTLMAMWDIAKSVFEAKGPVEFDLKDFENSQESIQKYLEGKNKENGGYGRYVKIQNAEAATCNSILLDAKGRNGTDVAYLTVSPNSALHTRYGELAQLIQGTDDANKTNVEKIITEQLPQYSNFRLILISPSKKDDPWNRRFDNQFWAGPSAFNEKNNGFVGVIRPFDWLPAGDQAQIIGAPGLKGVQSEKENHVYVLYHYELPPDEGTAYMTLVGPILFMLGGCALLLLGMRDTGGAAARRAAAGGGKGSRGKGRGQSRGGSQRNEPARGSQRREPSSSQRGAAKSSQRGGAKSSQRGGAKKSGSRRTGRVAKAPPQVD